MSHINAGGGYFMLFVLMKVQSPLPIFKPSGASYFFKVGDFCIYIKVFRNSIQYNIKYLLIEYI